MYNLIQVLKSDDPIGYKVGYAGTTFLIASAAAYVTGKLLDRTGKAIEPTDNLDASGLTKTRTRVAKILQLSGKVLTRPVEFPIEQAIIGGKLLKKEISDRLYGAEGDEAYEDEIHSIFGEFSKMGGDGEFSPTETGEMDMSFSQWADEAGFTIGKHKPTHEEFSDFFSKSKIIPISIREIFINMDESRKESLFDIFSQISQSSDIAQAEFQGMLLRRRKEITTAEQLVEISTSWMAERKVF